MGLFCESDIKQQEDVYHLFLGVDVHNHLLRVRPDKIQLRVPPTTANRVRGYVRFRDSQVLNGFSFDRGPAV